MSGLDTEENRLWSWSNFVIVREILLPSVRENLLLASTFVLRIDCYRLCLVNGTNLFAEYENEKKDAQVRFKYFLKLERKVRIS